jgi:hypothetical protein
MSSSFSQLAFSIRSPPTLDTSPIIPKKTLSPLATLRKRAICRLAMLSSSDQRALLWQRLTQPNKEQQASLSQQLQQQTAMMNLSDNLQSQQLELQLRLQQQLLPPALTSHASGQISQPSFSGSGFMAVQRYQTLQGMIAEEERLIKLRQLQQLHALQQYQELITLQRTPTRTADFVTQKNSSVAAASAMPHVQPSAQSSLTTKLADDTATTTSTTSTATNEARLPTPIKKEDASSPQKRRTKKTDTKWLTTLEELQKYRPAHGDCIVPRGYTLNPRLASWVAEQR